ncbi:MAG: hypothetical protein ACYC2T_05055 [Bacillota bacterium]
MEDILEHNVVKNHWLCYNGLEVSSMSKQDIDVIAREIGQLDGREKEELMKKVLDSMSKEEIKGLLQRLHNKAEVRWLLKVIEPVFVDWDSEEDSVYDDL